LAFGPRFAREPAAGGHQGAGDLHADVPDTVHRLLEGGRDGGSEQRPVRLNFRLIRGRSAAAGNVRSVPSRLVTYGHDCRRTGINRIGKRVGETLKSSNLLSSASALSCVNRKRAIPALWADGVVRLNRCLGGERVPPDQDQASLVGVSLLLEVSLAGIIRWSDVLRSPTLSA